MRVPRHDHGLIGQRLLPIHRDDRDVHEATVSACWARERVRAHHERPIVKASQFECVAHILSVALSCAVAWPLTLLSSSGGPDPRWSRPRSGWHRSAPPRQPVRVELTTSDRTPCSCITRQPISPRPTCSTRRASRDGLRHRWSDVPYPGVTWPAPPAAHGSASWRSRAHAGLRERGADRRAARVSPSRMAFRWDPAMWDAVCASNGGAVAAAIARVCARARSRARCRAGCTTRGPVTARASARSTGSPWRRARSVMPVPGASPSSISTRTSEAERSAS